jgi:hypothetical protein
MVVEMAGCHLDLLFSVSAVVVWRRPLFRLCDVYLYSLIRDFKYIFVILWVKFVLWYQIFLHMPCTMSCMIWSVWCVFSSLGFTRMYRVGCHKTTCFVPLPTLKGFTFGGKGLEFISTLWVTMQPCVGFWLVFMPLVVELNFGPWHHAYASTTAQKWWPTMTELNN